MDRHLEEVILMIGGWNTQALGFLIIGSLVPNKK